MKLRDEFLVSLYKNVYIGISSMIIFLFCELFLNEKYVEVCIGLRIYYIIFSLILFMVLEQIKKYNMKYIYKIVYKFFTLIIIISCVGLLVKRYNSSLEFYINYINMSSKLILIVEIIISYLLSEYVIEGRAKKEKKYLSIAISAMLFLCLVRIPTHVLSIIYLLMVVIILYRLIKNLMQFTYKKEYSLLIIYIFFAFGIEIYDNFTGSSHVNMKVEMVHFINFRIMWNIFCVNLVKRPFIKLSQSLRAENQELDKLNLKISNQNIELESSINELKRNENLESISVKFMPHPIVITNARNNRIIFANEKFLNFIEVDSLKEIVNKKVHKYINLKCNKLYYKNDVLKYITVNKNIKYFNVRLLNNYSNENTNLIIINDITSKIQTEEIKSELEEKKTNEHLRAKFISSISHDLKTPVNVIYSASQVEDIHIKNKDVNNLKKYNDISKNNCISLMKMTNNLIDNSKIKSNYLEPNIKKTDIVKVVEDNVRSLVEYVKSNNIDLLFNSNVDKCCIDIDTEFMQRIILNLISNAVKYTNPQGKIYVNIFKSDNYIEISVRDTGVGLKKEFIEKAFEIYTVSENKQMDLKSGSGIGLFIVKELVELQNGQVRIENNIDCGANCIITFPL